MQDVFFVSELLPEGQLRELIDRTGAGIELIRLSVSENLDRFDETLKETERFLKRLGNPPCSLHGPFLDLNPAAFDSRIRKVTMDRFGQAYEAARSLGAKRVVYHSGMIPSVYFTEGWAERMRDFWEEFLDGRSGLTVCMENVLDQEIWPVLETVQAVKNPEFGLCLDLGHAHCYGRPPVTEWAKRLTPYVRHVHIHDNDGHIDSHSGLSRGTVPWQECLQALACGREKSSADLTWTVECPGFDDALQSLNTIIHFMKRRTAT